ncbi:translocator protein [Prorops nasuta]|uniref:translocator protein n=1 Tax=Prorops nasuta TaxID=863751 RepID=UPI0034CD3A0B
MPVKISWPIVVATIHPNIGGLIGGYITRQNLNPWYQSLKKPSWTPPNWAFAPIWTSIYCTIGYSSYLVWRDGPGFEGATIPLALYGVNLALNWSWTPIFFGAHNIKLALYEILVLWGSTAAMGIAFYHINHTAGYLTIPYFAWTSLAAMLNYVIYKDNKSSSSPAIEQTKTK